MNSSKHGRFDIIKLDCSYFTRCRRVATCHSLPPPSSCSYADKCRGIRPPSRGELESDGGGEPSLLVAWRRVALSVWLKWRMRPSRLPELHLFLRLRRHRQRPPQ